MLGDVPMIDLMDETFVLAPRASAAAIIGDRARWRAWWPGLIPVVYLDRGLDGMRWTVSGELVGSAEIWLEAWSDGVILHYYLRADPTVPGSSTRARPAPVTARGQRQVQELSRRHAVRWKRHAWAIKDELESSHVASGTS